MGKRMLDILIVLVVLAIVGVGVVFVIGQSGAKDDDPVTLEDVGPADAEAADGLQIAELPLFTDKQLRYIVFQPAQLPSAYQDYLSDQPYIQSLADVSEQLSEMWPESARRFDRIRATYHWNLTNGVTYDTCRQDRPVSQIVVEASQLASTADARTLVQDPLVTSYFRSLFFTVTEAEAVHGMRMTSLTPDNVGGCFANGDYLHFLVFDYYGLVVMVQVNVNADADQSVADELLNHLAAGVMERAATLVVEGLPPTPVPDMSTVGLLTETMTNNDLAFTLPDLTDVMPANGASYFRLNNAVSHTYTLDEFVAAYQGLNLTELAGAVEAAGAKYGMQGQAVRVWDTGTACPSIVGISIEIDVALFNTPAGARDYMQDLSVQQAWRNTGMVSQYVMQGDEMLVYGSLPNHHCGPAQLVEKIVPYERLLITIAMNANGSVERSEVLEIVEAFKLATLSHVLLTAGD